MRLLSSLLLPVFAAADAGGICTDTRCGGAAKLCCEGSPALQKPSMCIGSVDCDSCCGWKNQTNSNYTPVLLMHGITGSNKDWDTLVPRLTAAHPGQFVHALSVFNDDWSVIPIWDQIPHITNVVRNLTKDYDEYTLMCHSQGGIVCRALIESMDDHKVANFISLAGVQQGVRGIPDSIVTKILPEWAQNITDDLAYTLFYTPEGQALSVGNYWRDPAPHARAKYLEFDALLPVVDNDPESTAKAPKVAGTASQRKTNFLKLKTMHLFGSPHDGVVKPWDSSLFATVNTSDYTRNTTVPMEQQPLFINDWFGLRTLNQTGRLTLTPVDGVEHGEWLNREDLFTTYLEPLLR